MGLKIAAETTLSKHFVLYTYYESDELPQHESIEFCPCYSFPFDLQELRHSGQLFLNDLGQHRKKLFFFTPSEIGAISLTSLTM